MLLGEKVTTSFLHTRDMSIKCTHAETELEKSLYCPGLSSERTDSLQREVYFSARCLLSDGTF